MIGNICLKGLFVCAAGGLGLIMSGPLLALVGLFAGIVGVEILAMTPLLKK